MTSTGNCTPRCQSHRILERQGLALLPKGAEHAPSTGVELQDVALAALTPSLPFSPPSSTNACAPNRARVATGIKMNSVNSKVCKVAGEKKSLCWHQGKKGGKDGRWIWGTAYLAAVLVSTNSKPPLLWHQIAGSSLKSMLKESSLGPLMRPCMTKTSKRAK